MTSRPESHDPADAAYSDVKLLLLRALDLPPERRRDWVLQATEGRQGLRIEALEILDQVDGLEHFMTKGPKFPTGDLLSEGKASMPFDLPATVGGMRILRILGFGGMGVVYLAEQDRPRRQVAVKVLHRKSSDAERSIRFRREVEILGRLKHPGIAQIYDAGFSADGTDGASWFSMEYVEGSTLGDHVRSHHRTREELVALVAQLADIVAYAHGMGILHRDLKPDNILIGPDGHPRLLDFGVARLAEDDGLPSLHTLTGAVIGTVAYMSPEQARGAQVDERSDVFSLGAILYELLSGRLPFETRGRSLQQLVRSLAEDEPDLLSGHDLALKGDLEAVVHTAIDTDPAHRYSTMVELAEDLRRWLQQRPVMARRRTVLDRMRKFVRRNKGLAIGSGLVLAALTIALILSLSSLRDSRIAAERKSRALADVVGFSRGYSIDDLLDRGSDLWPAGPGTIDGLRDLLTEAKAVVADLPEARAHLEELKSHERKGTLKERYGGALDGRWVLRMQETLLQRMEDLHEGLIARLQWRIAFADEVVGELASSQELWEEVRRDVAGSPEYRGLSVAPQPGLRPLGIDPRSGLAEFALVLPGCRIPERDPGTGRLAIEDDTTLVFVLVPGGPVRVGAQADDPDAPFYDPFASPFRWPVSERELSPFFVSKFEVTQYQWRVLTGDAPSYWHSGKQLDSELVTLRHPVESITWLEAVEFGRKLGLYLPTEVQFEYAARGGSTAATWWGGTEPVDSEHVNFLGTLRANTDPFRLHAPVGSFPPNGFGLHEIMGNVSEFCLDDYKLYPAKEPFGLGDARVLADGGGEQSVRGGNHDHSVGVSLSHRSDTQRDVRSRTTGLRPIRYLDGQGPTDPRTPR